tara:strand:+ start:4726 stop:4989 length:264 start_codon:yes stop_codon:yes gene_type:complete
MAYTSAGLTRMAGGGGHNIWYYDSTDTLETVDQEGYFNDAAGMINVGDIVFVYDNDAPAMTICTVLSNTGTVVDLSDGTALDLTDDD